MPWTETFNCDICGKQKGTVDHWWLAWIDKYRPHEAASEREMFKIYPWENMMAHDANARHLCGQACLPAKTGGPVDECRDGPRLGLRSSQVA